MASADQLQNELWELSLYEMHRTPQAPITDNTEIAVSPRSLHNEFMCPICLDVLKKTMTTKECLHRFCSDCIGKALRSGNKECPTCRKKLVSKRSLRPDPNFDLLIAKIFPSRDEYEAHQEQVLAKLNKSHSQKALVNSINQGMKLQSQSRFQRIRKNAEAGRSQDVGPVASASMEGGSAMQAASPNTSSKRSTPSPVPSSVSSTSRSTNTNKRSRSILTSERSEEVDSSEVDIRTESSESVEMGSNDAWLNSTPRFEVEMIFKPHPIEMPGDSPLVETLGEYAVRYLKTTNNATVAHLSKYLLMRLSLHLEIFDPEVLRQHRFYLYIWPQSFGPRGMSLNHIIENNSIPHYLIPLGDHETLLQILHKYWRVNRPLVLYYSWRPIEEDIEEDDDDIDEE